MEVIYANMKPKFDKPSIFLAGPTYRKGDEVVEGSFWRKDAINILKKSEWKNFRIGMNKFDGIVFAPERDDWSNFNYENQCEWEYECLENCTIIAFWIPRNREHLKARTTNVEFGRYVANSKTLYGRPDDSDDNKYLDWLYRKLHIYFSVPFSKLDNLMKESANCAYVRWNQGES